MPVNDCIFIILVKQKASCGWQKHDFLFYFMLDEILLVYHIQSIS